MCCIYVYVYYESIKREKKIRGIYECRCDQRLQTKNKEIYAPNKMRLHFCLFCFALQSRGQTSFFKACAEHEDGEGRARRDGRQDIRYYYYLPGGLIFIRGFERVLFLQETRRRDQGTERNKGRVRGERARSQRKERP